MLGKMEPKAFWTVKRITLSKLTYLQAAGMALVFGTNVYLTNALSNEQYGLYVSIVQGIVLLSILLIGGLDELITVEVPQLLKKGDLASANGMHRWSNRTIVRRFAILVLTVSLILVCYFILTGKYVLTITDLIVAGGSVLCTSFLLKQVSELRSTGNYTIGQFLESVIRPLGILLLLILMINLLGIDATASNALIVLLIVLLLTTFTAQFLLHRLQPYLRRIDECALPTSAAQWTGKNRLSAFNGSSILYFLITKLDLLLIVILESTASVGQYNVAGRLAEWCMLPAVILNMAYTREVSESSLHETDQRIPKLVRNLIGKSALFTMIMGAILLISGVWLLPLFGENYSRGYLLLFPLTASYLLMATAAPINHWLKVKGMESQSLRIAGIVVLAQSLTCGALIVLFGPMGAAWGMLLTNVLYFGLLLQAVKSIRV